MSVILGVLTIIHIDKISEHLSKMLAWVAGCAVVAIMILAVGNIIIRTFYRPFGPTYELITYFAALAFAFSLGYSQIKKVHVKIDFLVEKFSKRLRLVINTFMYFLSFTFFSVTAWQIIISAGRLHRGYAAATGNLNIPVSYLIYTVAFGFCIFAIVLLADLLRLLKEGLK